MSCSTFGRLAGLCDGDQAVSVHAFLQAGAGQRLPQAPLDSAAPSDGVRAAAGRSLPSLAASGAHHRPEDGPVLLHTVAMDEKRCCTLAWGC